MSLKTNLKQIILERGVVTLKEIEDYCHKARYKTSNAERRLRELRGVIEPIYNDKKTAIIAYRPIRVETDLRKWAMSGEETTEVLYNFNGELLTKRNV